MPMPKVAALAMASSMAMTLAGCPRPFCPSTRPVARSSRATVGSAVGSMKPRCVHSTYLGSMPIPCESTPRRSVRTIKSAVSRAFFGDILSASSTDTMNSARRSRATTTGSSAIAGSFSGRQSGDLDAGVLELVPAVDGGEHGRDALERPRVRERAHVDGPEAHAAGQLGHHLLRLRIPSAKQEVALDVVTGRRELVGGDVVERGDDSRL